MLYNTHVDICDQCIAFPVNDHCADELTCLMTDADGSSTSGKGNHCDSMPAHGCGKPCTSQCSAGNKHVLDSTSKRTELRSKDWQMSGVHVREKLVFCVMLKNKHSPQPATSLHSASIRPFSNAASFQASKRWVEPVLRTSSSVVVSLMTRSRFLSLKPAWTFRLSASRVLLSQTM